jgi:hypothetical protein
MDRQRTVREPARDVPVVAEVDVAVIGGGPAGFTAATAAARLGARVLLIERYGYLGGLATGGLVLLMDSMYDRAGTCWIGGIVTETMQRLTDLGGMSYEKPTAPHVDSELLKVVAERMCLEAGVVLRLHSWAVQAIVDGDCVLGVVTESKTGRQAILARLCIDATGDGDVAALAGCDYDSHTMAIGLPLKAGGIDLDAFTIFAAAQPERLQALLSDLRSRGGFRLRPRPTPYSGRGVYWINITGLTRRSGPDDVAGNDLQGMLSALDIDDLTYAEVELRRRILLSLDYYRQNVQGFANVHLLAFAAQLGVRDSRHIKGHYTLTEDDVRSGRRFEDGIGQVGIKRAEVGHYQIPYRSLVPHAMRGLLVCGRCISADNWVIDTARLIPPAMVTGQAAGTAAALCLCSGVDPAQVDVAAVQQELAAQGTIL